MIKSEKGNTIIEGDTADVLADFGCIYSILVGKLGKHIVHRTISLADKFDLVVGDNEHESN